MITRLFLLLVAFSLSACSDDKITVVDAELTNPQDVSIERIEFKTLNTEARTMLDAENPDALIAVFDESGVTLYGAPGKAFRLVAKERQTSESYKATKGDDREPVNDVVIKTFLNSPLCQDILVNGHPVIYGSCP